MRLAALDLGSNSFHLLVADARPAGGLRRVHTRKVTLRLGDLVAAEGEMGPDGCARAASTYAELLAEAQARGAERVVSVATDAFRTASDGASLRARLEAEHGVTVHLLDGDDEARLSLRAMAAALHTPAEESVLGVDLGGGSFDLAFGQGARAVVTASLPLGTARLGGRFVEDPPRLAQRAALHTEALDLLAPVAAKVGALADHTTLRMIGTAGTIRDLGRLGLAIAGGVAPKRVRGLLVTRDQLELAAARLASVPGAERAELPGVSAKRADRLPVGAVVVLATLEAFGLESLQLCDWGLREGALLDVLDEGGVISAVGALPAIK